MNFTVDRQTWIRGTGNNERSSLLTGSGKRCCLGFLGQACGIADAAMRHVATPADMGRPALWPETIILRDETMQQDSRITVNLMTRNDEACMTDEEREFRLTTLFAEAGIAVHFIN